MPDFVYKGLGEDGIVVNGIYGCADVAELDQWLLSKNIELLTYRKKLTLMGARVRLDVDCFIQFTSQLSQLLNAGVPLLESLVDLKRSQENQSFAVVLEQMHSRVESGQTLSLALENARLSLPPLAVPLIRVGEQSGNLADSLAELCKALKWQKTLLERWKKAIFYPLFSGGVLFLVCTFLMTYLVPSLVSFIQSTSYQLPWYTQLLIGVSDHIREQGLYYFVVAIMCVVLLSIAYRYSANIKCWSSIVLLKLLWVGPVLFRIKIARFTYFSGILYQAGVPILQAFQTSRDIMGSIHLERKIDGIVELVASGEGIGNSFQRAKIFPVFISRMLLTGEKTGRLDQSLLLISDFYQEEAEKAISRLEQMIGPILILVVGSFLVWIIVSVIGPIYEVVLSLGQNS